MQPGGGGGGGGQSNIPGSRAGEAWLGILIKEVLLRVESGIYCTVYGSYSTFFSTFSNSYIRGYKN